MTDGATVQPLVRPLGDEDVEAADDLAWWALDEVRTLFSLPPGDRDSDQRAWAQARIRHIAAFDPEGSFVAEHDGAVVGVGLAVRRADLWFLSLLAVRKDLHNRGIGRHLLEATLDYADGCPAAMICSSPDPRALRRYSRAGFALHAGFEASGPPKAAEMPGDLGVRGGDWDRDADLVEQLITERRGAPYGPDLGFCREQGLHLLVRDGAAPDDRAFALFRQGHIGHLAAASEEAAARVLWAAIAEQSGAVTVEYLLANQQWAVRVALAAGLSLKLTDTLCTRGTITPPSPYLPSGVFG